MPLLERERRERGVGRVARERGRGGYVGRSRCLYRKLNVRPVYGNGLYVLLLLDLEICYRTCSIKGYIKN